MSENEVVQRTCEGGVCQIVINRQPQLNALNTAVLTRLTEIVADLDAGAAKPDGYRECRVVTVSGAGQKAFVAGADIKVMQSADEVKLREFIALGQNLMRNIERLPLPVIAVVDGFAIGGGLELALACDLVIASSTSKLGQAEVNLGLIPGFGGTQRLALRTGIGAAKRLIFTGDTISADEAYRLGLVDWLVEPDEMQATVASVCQTLMAKGPLAIAGAKRVMHDSFGAVIDEGLHREVEAFVEVVATADGQEGLSAFVEKRRADFKGAR